MEIVFFECRTRKESQYFVLRYRSVWCSKKKDYMLHNLLMRDFNDIFQYFLLKIGGFDRMNTHMCFFKSPLGGWNEFIHCF